MNLFNSAAVSTWIGLALAGSMTSTTAHAQEATVNQGGIARWSGYAAESCGMYGKRFAAIDAVCYYPIDMKAKPGKHEVALYDVDGEQRLGWVTVDKVDFEKSDLELPDDTYVKVSAENLERHLAERKRVLALFKAEPTERKFSLPLGPPAKSIKLSSDSMDFGAIRVFNGERESQHTGADFPIPGGTPVKAVAAGTVMMAEEQFFTGNTVFIDHGNGLISMNFHLADISVKVGDELKRGDTVGTVGSTGRSTGPHLHLGLRWHAKRIDPRMLLHPTTELPDLGYAKK